MKKFELRFDNDLLSLFNTDKASHEEGALNERMSDFLEDISVLYTGNGVSIYLYKPDRFFAQVDYSGINQGQPLVIDISEHMGSVASILLPFAHKLVFKKVANGIVDIKLKKLKTLIVRKECV